jgi:hypothetical protein
VNLFIFLNFVDFFARKEISPNFRLCYVLLAFSLVCTYLQMYITRFDYFKAVVHEGDEFMDLDAASEFSTGTFTVHCLSYGWIC